MLPKIFSVKYTLIVLILMFSTLFHSSKLMGCDVNLVNLISSKTNNDVFVKKIVNLTVLISMLGQDALDKKKAVPALKKVMSKWVDFDNSFTQFPPEWAKKDTLWKKKFQNLADFIGKIIQNYKDDKLTEAHKNTLSLSRKLLSLFECMPMEPINKLSVKVSLLVDQLWNFFYTKKLDEFGQKMNQLVVLSEELVKLVPENRKGHGADFLARVRELKLFSTPCPATMNRAIQLKLEHVEESFIQLNSIQSVLNKRKEKSSRTE